VKRQADQPAEQGEQTHAEPVLPSSAETSPSSSLASLVPPPSYLFESVRNFFWMICGDAAIVGPSLGYFIVTS